MSNLLSLELLPAEIDAKRKERDDVLRKLAITAALGAVVVGGLIFLYKHVNMQISWKSGLIQIGGADRLRHAPNTQVRIGRGVMTPITYGDSMLNDKRRSTIPLIHFATNQDRARGDIDHRLGYRVNVSSPGYRKQYVAAHYNASSSAAAGSPSVFDSSNSHLEESSVPVGKCETFGSMFNQVINNQLIGRKNDISSEQLMSQLKDCIGGTADNIAVGSAKVVA